MEIFNIHIFEFLLIAGLALVVFGPERLPEVGRFMGQQVAKFLAWQQQSPELQMLNEVRGEFEREIASLRDELVRTRQQLDISKDLSAIKEDLRPMLDLKGGITSPANGAKPAGAAEPTIAPPATPPATPAAQAAEQAVEAAAQATEEAVEAIEQASEAIQAAAPEPLPTLRPAAQTVPAAAQPNRLALRQPTGALGTPGPAVGDQVFAEPDDQPQVAAEPEPAPPSEPEPAPAALAGPERDELLRRVQALAAELQALTAELQERGVLSPGWQQPAQPTEQETISR